MMTLYGFPAALCCMERQGPLRPASFRSLGSGPAMRQILGSTSSRHSHLTPLRPAPRSFPKRPSPPGRKQTKPAVKYELLAWPQLHDRMATAFASGTSDWDLVYMCGWVPEFIDSIVPYADKLPATTTADMPPSSFKTVTWDGKRYGAVFTLSLLTLFYNTEHLEIAGLKGPPPNLGRSQALHQGTDARRPLRLGARLRRLRRHRRHDLLLDVLSAAGWRDDVQEGRHARLQLGCRYHGAADYARSDEARN